MRRLTGFHAVEELLRSALSSGGGRPAGRILVSGSGPRVKAILELAAKLRVPVLRKGKEELDILAPGHRGLVLELEGSPDEGSEEADLDAFIASAPDAALVVVLDHIEDPQNFGAVIRSADVFSADLVVAPRRRAAPLSDAAGRASAGALAYVPVALVPNLAEALRRLAKGGFWLYAADGGGEIVQEADIPRKCVLVLGNEGAGVSRLLLEICDAVLSIPQSGHVDSLNVSAAAAVLMYEYRRRWPAAAR
jgi:23S rRNA (guanosine2251-2'-O)-methyltransferase